MIRPFLFLGAACSATRFSAKRLDLGLTPFAADHSAVTMREFTASYATHPAAKAKS